VPVDAVDVVVAQDNERGPILCRNTRGGRLWSSTATNRWSDAVADVLLVVLEDGGIRSY